MLSLGHRLHDGGGEECALVAGGDPGRVVRVGEALRWPRRAVGAVVLVVAALHRADAGPGRKLLPHTRHVALKETQKAFVYPSTQDFLRCLRPLILGCIDSTKLKEKILMYNFKDELTYQDTY